MKTMKTYSLHATNPAAEGQDLISVLEATGLAPRDVDGMSDTWPEVLAAAERLHCGINELLEPHGWRVDSYGNDEISEDEAIAALQAEEWKTVKKLDEVTASASGVTLRGLNFAEILLDAIAHESDCRPDVARLRHVLDDYRSETLEDLREMARVWLHGADKHLDACDRWMLRCALKMAEAEAAPRKLTRAERLAAALNDCHHGPEWRDRLARENLASLEAVNPTGADR